MFFRFQWIRFGTFVLLFLCLGCAVLGTGIVDYFIRWEQNKWRESVNGRQMTQEEHVKHYYTSNMMTKEALGMTQAEFEVAQSEGKMQEIWLSRKLPPGKPAPEFTLRNIVNQREVRLADFRDKKPVVLLFGSFGCDVFCGQLAHLSKLYQVYKNRAEFFLIYVKEGPHRNLLPPSPEKEDPQERILRGLRYFHLPFPCLFAAQNYAVQSAYIAFPERLIIVDRAGRVALDGGRGLPHGWDLAEVEAWLKKN